MSGVNQKSCGAHNAEGLRVSGSVKGRENKGELTKPPPWWAENYLRNFGHRRAIITHLTLQENRHKLECGDYIKQSPDSDMT